MSDEIPLELHIPVPPTRPGESASFAHLDIPPAGTSPRPSSDASAADIRPLAYGLIRVLDEAGQPMEPWNPALDPEDLRRGLRAMLMTRVFDERMFRAQRKG